MTQGNFQSIGPGVIMQGMIQCIENNGSFGRPKLNNAVIVRTHSAVKSKQQNVQTITDLDLT